MRQRGGGGRLPQPLPYPLHKLSAAVVEYLVQQHAADQSLRAKDLAEMVLKKFGLTVHPRSIERALAKRRKKGR